MICLNCRAEIEDLSMYCPRCGAPQFTPKHEQEVVLELEDPKKSKVVITEIDNLTGALSKLKEITGLSITEIRSALKELPAVLLDHLSVEDAKNKARELAEAGIKAVSVNGAVSFEKPLEDQ